ncbi:MAG: hypothetical protein Q8P00_02000, partial [Dehalococcoidia bacterium]|nr:hypothetical protein [Dehalococcoidia bacterium]
GRSAALRYSSSSLGRQKKQEVFDILAAIVLLPPHVNCDGLRAEAKGIRVLHWLRRHNLIKQNTNLIVRTFLLASNEFKEKMDTTRGMSESLVFRYRLLHLPKYVWVTEWTTLELWDRPTADKRILGEVLVDPTSNPYNLDFLALHVPNLFYFMNPDERDAQSALRRPLEIGNDKQYTPLVRVAS